jgi:hypothetical protein
MTVNCNSTSPVVGGFGFVDSVSVAGAGVAEDWIEEFVLLQAVRMMIDRLAAKTIRISERMVIKVSLGGFIIQLR